VRELSGRDSRDVGLQLVDGATLGRNDPIDEVADGDHAQEAIGFEHGQMPNPVVGHDPHAIFDGVIGGNVDDLAREDFLDRGLFRGFSLQSDFASVIALGKNAHELAGLSDEQSADVFIRHQLDGVEHRRFRRDGPYAAAFVAEDFVDGSVWIHD
jgi:hypothetical protein